MEELLKEWNSLYIGESSNESNIDSHRYGDWSDRWGDHGWGDSGSGDGWSW